MTNLSVRTNALSGLSLLTFQALEESGWKAGISLCDAPKCPIAECRGGWRSFVSTFFSIDSGHSSQLLLETHPARQAITELFGLKLKHRSQGWSTTVFDPREGMHYHDEIRSLSAIRDDVLLPIAETVGEAIILLGASLNVYIMGWVSPGVFIAPTFDAAVQALILGSDLELLEFDSTSDPGGIFTMHK